MPDRKKLTPCTELEGACDLEWTERARRSRRLSCFLYRSLRRALTEQHACRTPLIPRFRSRLISRTFVLPPAMASASEIAGHLCAAPGDGSTVVHEGLGRCAIWHVLWWLTVTPRQHGQRQGCCEPMARRLAGSEEDVDASDPGCRDMDPPAGWLRWENINLHIAEEREKKKMVTARRMRCTVREHPNAPSWLVLGNPATMPKRKTLYTMRGDIAGRPRRHSERWKQRRGTDDAHQEDAPCEEEEISLTEEQPELEDLREDLEILLEEERIAREQHNQREQLRREQLQEEHCRVEAELIVIGAAELTPTQRTRLALLSHADSECAEARPQTEPPNIKQEKDTEDNFDLNSIKDVVDYLHRKWFQQAELERDIARLLESTPNGAQTEAQLGLEQAWLMSHSQTCQQVFEYLIILLNRNLANLDPYFGDIVRKDYFTKPMAFHIVELLNDIAWAMVSGGEPQPPPNYTDRQQKRREGIQRHRENIQRQMQGLPALPNRKPIKPQKSLRGYIREQWRKKRTRLLKRAIIKAVQKLSPQNRHDSTQLPLTRPYRTKFKRVHGLHTFAEAYEKHWLKSKQGTRLVCTQHGWRELLGLLYAGPYSSADLEAEAAISGQRLSSNDEIISLHCARLRQTPHLVRNLIIEGENSGLTKDEHADDYHLHENWNAVKLRRGFHDLLLRVESLVEYGPPSKVVGATALTSLIEIAHVFCDMYAETGSSGRRSKVFDDEPVDSVDSADSDVEYSYHGGLFKLERRLDRVVRVILHKYGSGPGRWDLREDRSELPVRRFASGIDRFGPPEERSTDLPTALVELRRTLRRTSKEMLRTRRRGTSTYLLCLDTRLTPGNARPITPESGSEDCADSNCTVTPQ
ncbi:hypothetical protein BU23DRAFT_602368 [Bimuria novae-zelandiae CBS 107.79]|uniref:Uncharacterized protein n=1 Tax=Bimuria novae-zelandiae CBS 107.79 TaxID=1447943 RepID=A0A6A5USQ0_9PLEO|nr:hypothetical protein BU23DRAFT_602368 [Bimuria novae-zelandiae CBS 107.79]